VNFTHLSLLATRRFAPLFVTQFLGAMNDNLFRQAIIILITVKLADEVGVSSAVLNNVAIGLFILPYFLFSALAGQLADRFEKARQIVWIKLWEVGLMILGAFALYLGSLPMLIAVLSGLGLQSTFFGPIKYGILPDLVKQDKLLAANGLIEAGTFMAILLGLFLGGIIVSPGGDNRAISGLMIAVAVVGTLSACLVPKTGRAAPDLKINPNVVTSTARLLKEAWGSKVARPAILGISWIWLYGSIYIAQVPEIVTDRLGGDQTVITLVIACFSLGIGAGALLCSLLLKGEISARLTAPALLALCGVSLLFCLTLPDVRDTAGGAVALLGVAAVLAEPQNWIVLVALVCLAMTAGMVIVPLYTILQEHTDRAERSRVIAANNIINSGFMAGGTLVAAALISAGLSAVQVFLIYALLNVAIVPFALGLRSHLNSLETATVGRD
jgi:acyl-[acyl-carrier-protein]-phospholipid O-acyltransferase/long-chain-fatty-acid--[acyl-carrier-protein] ligase